MSLAVTQSYTRPNPARMQLAVYLSGTSQVPAYEVCRVLETILASLTRHLATPLDAELKARVCRRFSRSKIPEVQRLLAKEFNRFVIAPIADAQVNEMAIEYRTRRSVSGHNAFLLLGIFNANQVRIINSLSDQVNRLSADWVADVIRAAADEGISLSEQS